MNHYLIQNSRTGLFLGTEDRWTQRDHAHSFENPLQAIAYCLRHRLHSVQMVVVLQRPRSCEVVVPLQEEASVVAQADWPVVPQLDGPR